MPNESNAAEANAATPKQHGSNIVKLNTKAKMTSQNFEQQLRFLCLERLEQHFRSLSNASPVT
jgi:hypothetical protein